MAAGMSGAGWSINSILAKFIGEIQGGKRIFSFSPPHSVLGTSCVHEMMSIDYVSPSSLDSFINWPQPRTCHLPTTRRKIRGKPLRSHCQGRCISEYIAPSFTSSYMPFSQLPSSLIHNTSLPLAVELFTRK